MQGRAHAAIDVIIALRGSQAHVRGLRYTCARTDAWRSTSVSAFSSTCCASRRRSPYSCAYAIVFVTRYQRSNVLLSSKNMALNTTVTMRRC